MSSLLTVLIILASLILILVVLVQNSKGGGLASQFSASNQVMGVKKTTELIEKITWGLVVTIFILCLALSFSLKSDTQGVATDTALREQLEMTNSKALKNVPKAAQQSAKPASDASAQPASAPQGAAPAGQPAPTK